MDPSPLTKRDGFPLAERLAEFLDCRVTVHWAFDAYATGDYTVSRLANELREGD